MATQEPEGQKPKRQRRPPNPGGRKGPKPKPESEHSKSYRSGRRRQARKAKANRNRRVKLMKVTWEIVVDQMIKEIRRGGEKGMASYYMLKWLLGDKSMKRMVDPKRRGKWMKMLERGDTRALDRWTRTKVMGEMIRRDNYLGEFRGSGGRRARMDPADRSAPERGGEGEEDGPGWK